jgi:hypothetical protein
MIIQSTHKLNFIKDGCIIVPGADHRQGTWQSWLKISSIGGAKVCEKLLMTQLLIQKHHMLHLKLHTSNASKITLILSGSTSITATAMSAAYEKLLSK